MISAQQIYEAILNIIPTAQIDTLEDGQVIIYTNLKEEGRDEHNFPMNLVPSHDECQHERQYVGDRFTFLCADCGAEIGR